METNVRYINFPMSLLHGVFDDKQQTLSDILRYSVYQYSKKYEGSETNRMKNAIDYFNVAFYTDGQKNTSDALNNAIKDAKRVENSITKKVSHVSLNLDIFWDFYKYEKSEFEIACFCAFCAIKSILGNKDYVKTNKQLVISRMFGKSGKKNTTVSTAPKIYSDILKGYGEASKYLKERYGNIAPSHTTISNEVKRGKLKSVECCDDTRNISFFSIDRSDLDVWFSKWANTAYPKQEIKPQSVSLEEKYSKRYHIDMVLSELQEKWGLKLYSDHSRGFYLSFKKELVDLAMINELAKRKTKDKERAEKNRKAKEEALKRLNRK